MQQVEILNLFTVFMKKNKLWLSCEFIIEHEIRDIMYRMNIFEVVTLILVSSFKLTVNCI